MSVELDLAKLLRVANEDIDGARLLVAGHNRNAIALCEGATEKIIRAILLSEGQQPEPHPLGALLAMIPDENPLKERLRGTVENVSRDASAPETAMPAGPIPPTPRPDDFVAAINYTAIALREVATAFKVDLELKDTPARFLGPIR